MRTEPTMSIEFIETNDIQMDYDLNITVHPKCRRTSKSRDPVFQAKILTNNRSEEISFREFGQWYVDCLLNDTIRPIIGEAISNLIKSRDYLGLQLNYEFGNIDEKEFEQLETEYLTEQIEIGQEKLKHYIDMIVQLTNRVYNSEEISTMFNCPIDTSEKALHLLINKGIINGRDSD